MSTDSNVLPLDGIQGFDFELQALRHDPLTILRK